jgi:DNA helicase II / ATP-dependent DNA helicase PcrA
MARGKGGASGKRSSRQTSLFDDGPVWSEEQRAVFAAVERGARAVAVEARAGAGKTTLLCEAVDRMPDGSRVLVLAFSKLIEEELEKRMPKGVDVMTLHGLGARALIRAGSGLDREKLGKLLRSEEFFPHDSQAALRTAVRKLVERAKAVLPESPNDWWKAAMAAGVDLDAVAGGVLDKDARWETFTRVVDAAGAVLKAGLANKTEHDYDDMLYVPVKESFYLGQWDAIVVDEAQDLSPVQIRMIESLMVGGKTRILVVGDPHQAIFGFRGADTGAFSRLVRAFGCEVYPLSTTYRCPGSVVSLANRFVPDLRAAPGASGGVVREENGMDLGALKRGDFVLSRTNAPLVRMAIGCLGRWIPCQIAGRDIVGKIRELLAPILEQTGGDPVETQKAVEKKYARMLQKARESDGDVQELLDERACLMALCDAAEGPSQALDRLDQISKLAPGDGVTFSSCHRAKGLERDRVYLLADTFRVGGLLMAPGQSAPAEDNTPEEENLAYVAVTRAKRELVLVRGEK